MEKNDPSNYFQGPGLKCSLQPLCFKEPDSGSGSEKNIFQAHNFYTDQTPGVLQNWFPLISLCNFLGKVGSLWLTTRYRLTDVVQFSQNAAEPWLQCEPYNYICYIIYYIQESGSQAATYSFQCSPPRCREELEA